MGISYKSLFRKISEKRFLIILTLIMLAFAWMVYFIFTSIYRTTINPPEINKNEIVAKKQKVNLDLFTAINEKIKQKKAISDDLIKNIKNPWQ
jgi:cell division protein FtsL